MSDADGFDGGEGVEELLAVGFGGDAFVEDDDDAGVGFGADEAAETLFEFDDGFGEGVVVEGVSAGGADSVEAGFDDGFVGDFEGELGDDDVGEGVALDVDALPEGVGAEEDGVGGVFEAVEELAAGEGVALGEEGVAEGCELGFEEVCGAVEHGIGGEEDEGAALGLADVVHGAVHGVVEEVAFVGGGEGGFEVEGALGLVVEGGAEEEFGGVGDAGAASQVCEGSES